MMDELQIARAKNIAGHIMAYPFRIWGYGEEIGLEALLFLSEVRGDQTSFDFAYNLVSGWIDSRREITPADHVAPGRILLMLHDKTREVRFLNQAMALAHWFEQLPRLGNHPGLHHPDHPTYTSLNFVDCMDVDAPFLCTLGRSTGEQRWLDLGADIITQQVRTLWDNKKRLFYHVYDYEKGETNGAFWGRGNCWAFLGLLSTLNLLTCVHPTYPFLLDVFQQHARMLTSLQDSSGNWHTVLDRPETYLENSVAAFLCYVFTRAVEFNLLENEYLQTASAARKALFANIDDTGLVLGGSSGTPPGDAQHYNGVKTGGNFPWVQGPALLSALLG